MTREEQLRELSSSSAERYAAAFATGRQLTDFERFLLSQADHLEDMLIQAESQLRYLGISPLYRPKHTLLVLRNDN